MAFTLVDTPFTLLGRDESEVSLADRPTSLVPDALLGIALAFSLFFPVLEARLHGTLTPLVVVLFAIWVNGVLATRRSREPVRSLLVLGGVYTLFILALTRLLNHQVGGGYAVTVERVTLLLPLAGLAGWMVVRSGRLRLYLSWLMVGGLISVPAAVLEYVGNVTLLRSNHEAYVRNGQTRAVVGADHPLVLGALLLALIPLAMYLFEGSWLRYAAALALYTGVWMTGSNGPEAVGAVVLVICLAPPLARFVLDSRIPLLVFLTGLTTYLVVGAYWLWSPQIHGTTTTDVSDGYRGALYNLTPKLLSQHPLGFGFNGLPANTYLFYTTSGVVDVANSIDSEFVYAVTQFGWIAVLVYAFVAVVGALGSVRHQALGLSSLSITMVGLFLAIHSWNSLGSFWAFGVGGCLATLVARDERLDWHGLGRRRSLRATPGAEAVGRR